MPAETCRCPAISFPHRKGTEWKGVECHASFNHRELTHPYLDDDFGNTDCECDCPICQRIGELQYETRVEAAQARNAGCYDF